MAETVRAPVPATPPAQDLRPVLESLRTSLVELEQRRQQSLGELQQVAIELAVAAASHLVCTAIDKDEFAVEALVSQAVERFGFNEAVRVVLHPQDLELLRKQISAAESAWNHERLVFQPDAGVGRGSCRVESPDGRIIVSEIASRLSEIRRHWLEELDDAQVERRNTQGESSPLKRFPDRRETA